MTATSFVEDKTINNVDAACEIHVQGISFLVPD